jgi:hypothetical protein
MTELKATLGVYPAVNKLYEIIIHVLHPCKNVYPGLKYNDND